MGFVKKLRGLTKLSDRSETMVYLGTKERTKEYRLYHPSNRKIVVARDVVFDEAKYWALNNETMGETLTTPYWTNVVVSVTAQSQLVHELEQIDDVNEYPLTPLNEDSHLDHLPGNSSIASTPLSNSHIFDSRSTPPSQASRNYNGSGSVASYDNTPAKGF